MNQQKVSKKLPIKIIINTYTNWRDDRTIRLGAGIAYYGVFAIVPVFTLMFAVAAFFYSVQDIQIFIGDSLGRILGEDLLNAINLILNRVITDEVQNTAIGAGIIGVIALLISASFMFVALQDAFDVIWHNPVRLGFKKWIRKYAWSYIVVVVLSLLLLSAILLRTAATYITSVFPDQLIAFEWIGNVAITIATWALGVFVLALIYKLLIYESVAWRIILFGATITSFLIYIGTWLLSVYISNYGGSSVSGTLGTVLLLLVWIYYEAQIVLAGAQFIKTLQQHKKNLPWLHSQKN